MSASAAARGATSQAAEEFAERGYVVVRSALPAGDLEPFRSAIARAVDRFAGELRAQGKIDEVHAGEPIERRLVSLLRGQEFGRSWDEPVFGPELHGLITHPGLVAPLRAVLGERVRFDGGHRMRPKLPHSELTAFPYHQDSQYYGRGTEHALIVSLWVPLVDVDEANGCLWIIPGSQRWGLLGGARGADLNIRTDVEVERMGAPEPLPMRRGDIVLFSNLTVHGSKVNATGQVRWSIDLRYTADVDPAGLPEAERASLAQYRANLVRDPGFTVSGPAGPETFATWSARRALVRGTP